LYGQYQVLCGNVFSALSLVGIGFIAIPTGIISAGFMHATAEKQIAAQAHQPENPEPMRYCPRCGKALEP